jgi:hypothetical protein
MKFRIHTLLMAIVLAGCVFFLNFVSFAGPETASSSDVTSSDTLSLTASSQEWQVESQSPFTLPSSYTIQEDAFPQQEGVQSENKNRDPLPGSKSYIAQKVKESWEVKRSISPTR